ncbi:MAG: hypothetical protein WBA22_01335 [Candidatus Methanofastidiosia archaeon]
MKIKEIGKTWQGITIDIEGTTPDNNPCGICGCACCVCLGQACHCSMVWF